MRILVAVGSFALLALSVACGSASTPTARLADAQSAVRAADEIGAERHPRAALHLKLARDQIAKARGAIAEGEDSEAARLLERAEADAELAVALARHGRYRAEARRAADRAAELEASLEQRRRSE
jgi:hypothetical protein